VGDRDFIRNIALRADPATVYRAVATREGIQGWWTLFTDFDDREGSVAEMRFPTTGFFTRMLVEKLEPYKRVHWKCVDAIHPPGMSKDRSDWIGTEVTFEIEPGEGDATRLLFTHAGLGALDCHDVCRVIWDYFLQTSLKAYVEEGQGKPTRE